MKSFGIAAFTGLWSSLLYVLLGMALPLILQQLAGTFLSHNDTVSSRKEVDLSVQSSCREMKRKDGWSRQESRISTFGLEGISCFDTPREQCLNI